MRGTRGKPFERASVRGIIPAYAGNTVAEITGTTGEGDHPRVCGEHSTVRIPRGFLIGSSPRMRGTHIDPRQRYFTTGIIPAYAGNTHVGHCRTIHFRDHPRVCGEHVLNADASVCVRGSSPRMRGTRWRCQSGGRFDGIIPAYAGNTCWCRQLECRTRDHPRVCGEHG